MGIAFIGVIVFFHFGFFALPPGAMDGEIDSESENRGMGKGKEMYIRGCMGGCASL